MTARAPILCKLFNNRTNHKILKRKTICILENNIYKKYKHNIDILDIQQPQQPILDIQQSQQPILDIQQSQQPILDIQQQQQPILDIQQPQQPQQPILDIQQPQQQAQPQPQLDIEEISEKPEIPDKQYKKDNIPKRIKELVWITYNGELFSKKCFVSWCNNITNVFNFHTGHDIPNSKGGTLDIENLKPICSSCNLSMGNKYTITEWCKLLNN
jgi:hypothetical protein